MAASPIPARTSIRTRLARRVYDNLGADNLASAAAIDAADELIDYTATHFTAEGGGRLPRTGSASQAACATAFEGARHGDARAIRRPACTGRTEPLSAQLAGRTHPGERPAVLPVHGGPAVTRHGNRRVCFNPSVWGPQRHPPARLRARVRSPVPLPRRRSSSGSRTSAG